MSESIAKLSAALVSASAEMPAVSFDEQNPFLKNRFASLGAVIAAVRPILAKHNLAIMQFACSDASGRVGVKTRLIHSSGEYLEEAIYLDALEEKGKSRAQVAGSIITYLRRYSQSAMLNLYADADTDGTGTDSTHRPSAPSSTPARPPKAVGTAPGAPGEAKGSASPAPDDPEKKAKACKARFLQVIAEKKWEFFAWLYAVKEGWILHTERLEDGSPAKFPATADAYAKAEEAIKALMSEAAAHNGPSQEEQEAYDAAHIPDDLGPAESLEDSNGDDDVKHEPWMDVQLHFGPQKGTKLGDLDQNKLFGWAKNYQPKPYNGKLNPKDVELRRSLDGALSWMERHREFE